MCAARPTSTLWTYPMVRIARLRGHGEPMRLRTLVASSHGDFRCNLARLVQLLDPCIEVVGEAATAGDVLAAVGDLRPDLTLLDLGLWPGNTLQLVPHIRRQSSTALVVVIGNQSDLDYREAALAAGALDYVDVLDLTTALPAALARVPQLIACRDRIRQTTSSVELDETRPSPVVQLPAVRRRRGPLTALRTRLQTAPTGPKLGPYTTWQYVHLGLVTVLGEVILTVRHAPDLRIERDLLLVLCLIGITVLETLQFARGRRAAQVVGVTAK